MWRFYLVDLILFLAAASAFLLMPLRNEFIYKRVAEKHHYNESGQSYCGPNGTNQTNEDTVLADEVSRWTMLINLSIFVPAMLAGALLTSWGDRVGRKITIAIPLAGMTVSSIIQALIIYFHWPLEAMYAYGAVAGGTGYFMTVLIQGTAYLGDVTELEGRGKRFTILETFIGIGGGVAGLGGGYWIKAQGFLPSVWCTAALTFIALLIVPFLPNSLEYGIRNKRVLAKLKNDKKAGTSVPSSSSSINSDKGESPYMEVTHDSDNDNEKSPLLSTGKRSEQGKKKYTFFDLWRAVWKVYSTEYMTCDECFGPNPDIKQLKAEMKKTKCEHAGGIMPGRVWRLWLYIISYCTYMFLNVGIIVFQTIFFLSYPLCFTPVLVGAQLSTKFISVVAGPILVYLFQKCGIGNQAIIVISLVGYFGFPFLMIFAKSAWLVFVATSMMTIGCIPKPFIQAQVSSLASESEQGAAFAMLSSSEVLSFLLATVCYLTIYPATQYISHWFSWMFSAGIALIPLFLMGIVWIIDKKEGRTGRIEYEQIAEEDWDEPPPY
ncbi:proton-coupled folate transporter-like isoform X1 [Styela clava]